MGGFLSATTPPGLASSDTVSWFRGSRSINEWLQNSGPQLLWISAGPGYGKTTNVYYLCDKISNEIVKAQHYDEKDPSKDKDITVMLRFFCHEGSSETSTSQAVLRSFLAQMIDVPAYRQDVIRIINARRISADPTLRDDVKCLWELFVQIIDMVPRLYVILDAIDECVDGDDRALLIASLYQHFKESKKPWKLLITSRVPPSQPTAWSHVEIQPEDMEKDLELYVAQRLATFDNVQNLDQNESKLLARKIVSSAHGMFLWVKLSLDEVQEVPSWKVEETLEQLPSSLTDSYNRLFERIRNNVHPQLYRQILNLCLCIAAAPEIITFPSTLR